MITFDNISLINWSTFEEYILNSEKAFSPEIRSERDDFISVFQDGGFGKVIKLGSQYIGNIIGYDIIKEEFQEHDLEEGYDSKALYIFNFVIDPAYQNMGYGSTLLLEFMKTAIGMGYEKILGHFKPSSSLSVIARFNPKILKVHHNWYDTGEDYILCEVDLKKILLPVHI